MTLKWSILWIGFIIIFSEHVRDCEPDCGCGHGKSVKDTSRAGVKFTSPTSPDVQVPRDALQKHQKSNTKPLDKTLPIGLPSFDESENVTEVTTAVCQVDESFWIAIGLRDFFQKHVMKGASENNQQNAPGGRVSLLRTEKASNLKDEHFGSRLQRTIPQRSVIDKVLLLSDLEGDNLNPQECCVRLNSCVTPRLGAQVLLITSLFLSGHWWLSLSNVPLLFWFMFEKILLPKNNAGVYDLLEIYSRNGIQKHMMKSLLNISWLLIALSLNMYFAMQALLSDDELQELPVKWNNTEY